MLQWAREQDPPCEWDGRTFLAAHHSPNSNAETRLAVRASSRVPNGRAVQVEPMTPVLNAPGTKLLKLKYDDLLSGFAINVNLCRYTTEYIMDFEPDGQTFNFGVGWWMT